MAHLVYVGPNPNNLGGNSSKGYMVRKYLKTVIIQYGPIDVHGARGGRYAWRGIPREERRQFRSDKATRERVQELIAEKEAKGYRRLAVGVKIQHRE